MRTFALAHARAGECRVGTPQPMPGQTCSMNICVRIGIYPPRLRPANRSDMNVMGVAPRMCSNSGSDLATVTFQSSAGERAYRRNR